MDYACMAMHAFTRRWADIDSERHRFIVGLHWIGYYDFPLNDVNGYPDEHTANWGLVNPRYGVGKLPYLNTSEPEYDIVEGVQEANCVIQTDITGEPWNGGDTCDTPEEWHSITNDPVNCSGTRCTENYIYIPDGCPNCPGPCEEEY